MTQDQTKTIAFVIYEGLTPLDFIGPLSALGHLGDPYKAVVVAEHTNPMNVESGILKFSATHTFEEVPNPYVIVVPGGGTPTIRAMANPAITDYIKKWADSAEYVTSVCTGALILAATGLLEGRKATTHWGYRPELEKLGVTYLKQRWVEDGKFITAAGVSAGIDMGLFLASRLTSEARAKEIQRGMEYDPEPPFGRIDWTGADELITDPSAYSDEQKQTFKDALAGRPDLYERIMA
jgi:transcriptional regulator GlxA family with amidase domain